MSGKQGAKHAPPQARFMDNVIPELNTGCWLWLNGANRAGYGRFHWTHQRGTISAHRASYEIHVGDPGDLHILHKCDTPSCVNPSHLFLGTAGDNVRDCVSKSRNRSPDNRGENGPKAKLTEDQVRHIRRREMRSCDYATLYGVGRTTIAEVLSGRNWSHVV